MAIALTLSNILQFISFIAPTFLIFFLFLASIFNQNLKGLVYIAGVLMASFGNVILMNIVGSERDEGEAFSCSLFDIPFVSKFNSPYPTTLIIAFTITYLLMPMKYNNNMNYPVAAFLFVLLVLDILTKVQNKCTTYPGAFLGALVGALLGLCWYGVFSLTGYKSLLYFDELRSDKVMCSKPTKQTFKCQVYKNGELISRSTT
jgi:hypothetical protein